MTRHGRLLAVCASELGTLLVFSSLSALLPILQIEWGLSSTQGGLVVGVYQVGSIGAVAILSTLTDSVPPRRIYLGSALWTAATAVAFTVWARGFLPALVLRSLVGLGLAGACMPGMRMVAERDAAGGRGFAMGCSIGTFTIGTSRPRGAPGSRPRQCSPSGRCPRPSRASCPTARDGPGSSAPACCCACSILRRWALGPIAFGAVPDGAPRLGASAGGAWMWAWAAMGAGALVGPLAVGFREFSRRPAGL